MKNITWIGLGHMGAPMALNLVKAGFTVHGYDVQLEAAKALADQGLIPVTDLKAAIQSADIVFTMVQTGEQVKGVCLALDGIFENVSKNAIYVDCSSIDIQASKTLHQLAKEKKLKMLDAPVSGGVTGAAAGTLTLMVGGDKTLFETMLPVFQKLGKNIVHAGEAGNGQAAKICNNLILGVSMIGVCEGFMLAEKLGLDAKTFFEISSVSSGQCWSMTSYCPSPNILPNVPSSHDYAPGFMAKMMLKDLKLAKAAAAFAKAYTPLCNDAEDLYNRLVVDGQGEQDFSVMLPWLKDLIPQ